MAEKKITVSLVTPEEHIFEGETDSIIVPASSGSLGILPGHVPIVARLAIGIVKIGKGDDARYFGIQRGYIEFLFNKANILTERAVETTYERKAAGSRKAKREI